MPWLLLPLKEAAQQVWGAEFFFPRVFWGHQCDIYWNPGLKGRQSIVNQNAEVQQTQGGG